MRLTFLTCLAITAGFTGSVRADDSEAKRLWEEARALMLAGEFERACPLLDESYLREPRLGTLLNLAACHERLGKIATAWVEYQRARDMAREAHEPERERLAEERIEAIEPRVPWLTLTLPKTLATGSKISVDGVLLDPERWSEPLPIDPGDHLLVAEAPGHRAFKHSFSIDEAERESIAVAKLELVRPKIPPMPARPTPKAPAPQHDEPERRWVLELGLFGGYLLFVEPDYSRLAEDVALTQMGQPTSCNIVNCSFQIGLQGGAVLGVNLFAGYQVSETFDIGGRIIVGPRVGGGLVGATGPSASLQLVGPLWVGFGAMVGGARFVSDATIQAPTADVTTLRADIEGTVGVAFGPMVELEVQFFDTAQGALVANTTPLVLFGTEGGIALTIPASIGFRFH